ncbi:hypothetical protein [Natronoglomus mannanivorans]|uniref:Uncharacterized protein n=1 Tax=Natronoglomus mannanivorans TaxID=2979990 RepID=A0AAP2YVX2_9EURY|nr:hypothetical protein [Halobacteria archaeon AArc-xg1-1]
MDPSRRRLLMGLGTGVLAGFAGCTDVSLVDDDAEPLPVDEPEAGCPDGRTDAKDFFDERLIAVESDEYTDSVLTFSSVTPAAVLEDADLFAVDLRRPERLADRIAVPMDEIDRVTHVTPPGDGVWPLYVVFETPVDREEWERRFVTELQPPDPNQPFIVSPEARPDYRDYTRFHMPSLRVIDLVAYDDDHIVVGPAAEEPVESTSKDRVERLLDLEAGEGRPHHCLYADVRELVTWIPVANAIRCWFRTTDDPFPEDHRRGPAGARASALTVDVRDASDDDATDEDRAVDETQFDLAFTTVFRADEVDTAAVDAYVDRQWTETRGLGFEDPSVDRDGRVVTVSETRLRSEMTR